MKPGRAQSRQTSLPTERSPDYRCLSVLLWLLQGFSSYSSFDDLARPVRVRGLKPPAPA